MWTYDPANLTETSEEGRKNIVRLLVGDTDSNDPLLQDEEILFALNSNKDRVYSSAVFCVNAIISKLSRLVNVELDEAIREDYSDLIKNLTEVRVHLERKSKFTNGAIRISATGLTKSDFEAAETDPNRIKPGIRRSEWKYGNQTYRL